MSQTYTMTSAGEDAEKPEPLCPVGGWGECSVERAAAAQTAGPLLRKLKIQPPRDPAIPPLRANRPGTNRNQSLGYPRTRVQRRAVRSRQEAETTQVPADGPIRGPTPIQTME